MNPHHHLSLFLDGPAGRLEAILWTPRTPRDPPLASLVCHPHPLFGGTLHNKVVYQVAKTLGGLGLPVLRFNFRGAGLSEGQHDPDALHRGERDDVRAALDFLAREFPGLPILLAGFSFGCWVGLRAGCEDARVAELVGLGAPVNDSDFSYLETCAKPKLFLHGERDQFGSAKSVEALVKSLPGENRFLLVEDADHFFAGKLPTLAAGLSSWLTGRRPSLMDTGWPLAPWPAYAIVFPP